MFRKYFLPRIVYWFYSLLSWTWRIQIFECDDYKDSLADRAPSILAHWHGDELAVLHLVKNYKLVTMTSSSKDGELINYVINKMGGNTSRGSSSKGSIGALKGLVRLMKTGRVSSMAVDGPRGPIYQIKPGVFELSRLTKAKIFTVAVQSSSAFVFEKSWNKANLPKPFAKVCIYIGPVTGPISREQDPRGEEPKTQLNQAFANAKQKASKLIAEN